MPPFRALRRLPVAALRRGGAARFRHRPSGARGAGAGARCGRTAPDLSLAPAQPPARHAPRAADAQIHARVSRGPLASPGRYRRMPGHAPRAVRAGRPVAQIARSDGGAQPGRCRADADRSGHRLPAHGDPARRAGADRSGAGFRPQSGPCAADARSRLRRRSDVGARAGDDHALGRGGAVPRRRLPPADRRWRGHAGGRCGGFSRWQQGYRRSLRRDRHLRLRAGAAR